MTAPPAPLLFDRALLRGRQARASKQGAATFLRDRVAEDLTDRLQAVLRKFESAVDIGTPGRVVDRLKQLEEELGLDGILAELNPGSLVPHARVMEALRLLCEEVMPKFR